MNADDQIEDHGIHWCKVLERPWKCA